MLGLFVCLFVGTYLQDIACIKEEDHRKLHKSLLLTVVVMVKLDYGKIFNHKLFIIHVSSIFLDSSVQFIPP